MVEVNPCPNHFGECPRGYKQYKGGTEMAQTQLKTGMQLNSNRINKAGILAVIGAAGTWSIVSWDNVMISFGLPGMLKDLNIPLTSLGLWMAIISIIGAAWTFVVGPLTDKHGRKFNMQLNISLAGIGSILTGLITQGWMMIPARGIVSGAFSGGWGPAMTLVSESVPEKNRGFWIGVSQAGFTIGEFMATGLAWLVVDRFGWRVMFFCGALAFLWVIYIRKCVSEAPRYLLIKEMREAQQVGNVGKVNQLKTQIDTTEEVHIESVGMSALFKPDLIRKTIAVSLFFFFTCWGNATVAWYFVLFTTTTKGVTAGALAPSLMVGTIIGFFGYIFAGFVGDKIGRKWGIVIYSFIGAFAIYGMVYWATSLISISLWYSLFYGLGLPVAVLQMGAATEMFPTRARGSGVSFAAASMIVGGAGAGYFAPTFAGSIGWYSAMFWSGVFPCLIAAIVALVLFPNIRPGKKLEEVAN